MPASTVPGELRETFSDRPEAAAWLETLPSQVTAACDRWDLTVEDEGPWHGYCSLVVPVRRVDGSRAVLKVGWPHPEGESEAAGLRAWGGAGAVRLLDQDGWTLLLERVSTRDLEREPLDVALTEVASLWPRLHVSAPAGLPPVSADLTRWATELPERLVVARDVVPALAGRLTRLLDAALPLLDPLAAVADTAARLLHRDLHFGNVLRALEPVDGGDPVRQGWLAIDPKPAAGHPAYEVAPLLWNRWDEAVATGDVGAECRRRADLVTDVGGLAQADVAAWTVVRQADNAVDAAAEGFGDDADIHLRIGEAFLGRL